VIVTNIGLRQRAPEIVAFLGNYEHTYEQINAALLYMKDNDTKAPEAAIWFLKTSEDVWTEWVPADVAAKVKAALAE